MNIMRRSYYYSGQVALGMKSVFLFTFLFCIASQPMALAQQFSKVTSGAHVNDLAASRSVNWIDYDGDGYLDLFVSRGKEGGQNNMMYRNTGAPNFAFAKMDTMIISRDNKPSDGSSWGDIDNDGDADLFVANWYDLDNMLYINNGYNSFTQVTSGAVVTGRGYSETGSWGDYNNDGLLDLYVANSSGDLKNFLYKNLGNNQFQKITTGAIANDAGHSRGVSWIDYDGDNDLDMLVSNEASENEFLYRNMMTETGIDTFAKVSAGLLVNSAGSTWSASWGDYDNDGDPDVFMTDFGAGGNRLFRNDGGGAFEIDSLAGINEGNDQFATSHWIDYDNDADLDLFVTTAYVGPGSRPYLYKNLFQETDTAKFQKVLSEALVQEVGNWYGVSWGDYDNDGDADVFVAGTFGENSKSILYHNNGNSNSWLKLDCRGTVSNRSAIGAKVRVKATINGSPVWQMRTIEGQSGYCGQNLNLYFGLGNAVSIDSLNIEWPSGINEVFTNIGVNKFLTIVEQDSTPVSLAAPSNGFMNTDPRALLQWHKNRYGAPYYVQIATDSTFASGIVMSDSTVPDTAGFFAVQSNNSTYYWRVRSARTIYPGLWSDVRTFSNQVVAPSTPIQSSPSDGAVNQPITPTLRWLTTALATTYRIQVSTDSLFGSTLVDDSTVVDTSRQISALQNYTKYYWRVRAENVGGVSAFSLVRSFTTVIDTPAAPQLLLPSNAAIDLPTTVTVSWQPSSFATMYQLQFSTDSNFVQNNTNVIGADTSKEFSSLQNLTTYFWRVRASNSAGVSPYSPKRRFTTAIGAPAISFPANGDMHQPVSLTFQWGSVTNAIQYDLNVSTDSNFSSLLIDETALTDTFWTYDSLTLNSTYYWRVRAKNGSSTSAWTERSIFGVDVFTTQYEIRHQWNLISVPKTVNDFRKSSLFAFSVSNAFSYESGAGYAQAETLKNLQGYWIKFPSDSSLEITGYDIEENSIPVKEGWNLIGAGSQPVAVASLTSEPPGVVASLFYGYDNGYQATDSLYPARGYWVRVNMDAELFLSPVTRNSTSRITIVESADLPPAPPDGELSRRESEIPRLFGMEQNYPNPFNPLTMINYQLVNDEWVTLKVYNILGEEVSTIVDGIQEAGYKTIQFNAGNLASGMYTYRLTAGTNVAIKKMLLLR